MVDATTEADAIRCPKCQSTNWRCWDERSLNCWNPDGSSAGVEVAGGLACNDCGYDWIDYSVRNDDPDCECDGWND